MKLNKWILALMGVSIIGTMIVYPGLPQKIPVHWNAEGEIDRYGGKVTALLTAFVPMIMYLLMFFLPKIDPKRESYQKHGKAYMIFANLLVIFLIMLHWTAIAAAYGYNVNMGLIAGGSIGILFIVIGNYMRQIRHNYFFGIKTPWTLANEEVWVKTHRIGSWFFIISGLLFIAGGLLNGKLGLLMPIYFLIGSVIFLFAYSYFEFRRIKS